MAIINEWEFGDLEKPGTRIWCYTGIGYYLTLGWKAKLLSKRRGIGIACKLAILNEEVLMPKDEKVRWLTKKYVKRNEFWNQVLGCWSPRWQITPDWKGFK